MTQCSDTALFAEAWWWLSVENPIETMPKIAFCLFPGNFRQSKKTYNFENQQCGGSAAVNARTLYRQNGGDIAVMAVHKGRLETYN